MGLVDLITVLRWDMKRLHDGLVDRIEESRHFGLGSSFNSIDSDQWHGVILPFCIPSQLRFLDPRECHAAVAPVRILFTILTSKGSLTSSPPVCFKRLKWGVAMCRSSAA